MLKNPQRPLNSASPMKSLNVGTLPAAPPRAASSNIARAGAEKHIADAPTTPGMVRQTPDSFYTGPGQTKLDDEKEPPLKSSERAIQLHPATTPAQRATIDASNDPGAILRDAARLGRPGEKA